MKPTSAVSLPFLIVAMATGCAAAVTETDPLQGGSGGQGGAGGEYVDRPGGNEPQAGSGAVGGGIETESGGQAGTRNNGGQAGNRASVGGAGTVGGQAGTQVGGAAGTPSITVIPDPGNAPIDYGACEPGGNCKVCTDRSSGGRDQPMNFRPEDFPGPVFIPDEKDGSIVVDAESLRYSKNWNVESSHPKTLDGSTFAGRGYIRWNGYATTGHESDADPEQIFQGDRCDWIVLKVWIPPEKAGYYIWEGRNFNREADGDNDVWTGYIGQTGKITKAWHQEQHMLRFTVALKHKIVRNLPAGLHAYYFQGRSPGWGIDRVILHNGKGFMSASDPKRAPNRPYPAGWFSSL